MRQQYKDPLMFEDDIEETSPDHFNEAEVTIYDIPGNTYTSGKLMAMYVLTFLLNAFVNVDHGAVPVINPVLREEQNLTNQQLGFIGSLVFFGLLIGSIFATYIFGKVPYKLLLMACYLGNGVGLFMFGSTKVYWWMAFSRFMSGYFQVSENKSV